MVGAVRVSAEAEWVTQPSNDTTGAPCAAPSRRGLVSLLQGVPPEGLERPRLELDEHRLVATWVRDLAARPRLVCDPLHYAVRLGFVVLDRVPQGVGGETTDGTTILYRWHESPRIRGLRVAHGLAHAVLVMGRWAHCEADAWIVAAELLWPTEMARRVGCPATGARLQPHAPRWLIEAQTIRVLREASE